jgi:hypothetical protein
MTDTDFAEGYADAIAARDPQTRPGDMRYLAGFAQGAVDNVTLLLRKLVNALAPAAAPVAYVLNEDE